MIVTGKNRFATVFQATRRMSKDALVANYYLSGTNPEPERECTDKNVGMTCGDVISDQFWGPRRGLCAYGGLCLYGN